MKLRFSNAKNFAITFDANDVNEFYQQAVSTLRSFRIQTERRVHQGELHQTRSWFENVELHVYSETFNIWQDLSEIKFTDEMMAYRQTFKMRFPTNASNLDHICDLDKKFLDKNAVMIWRGLVDSNDWANQLNNQIMNLNDEIRRKTDDENG